MAANKLRPSLDDLKARVAALGPYELIVTNDGAQLVLEKHPNDGPIEAVFIHRNAGDADLVRDFIEPREREKAENDAVRRGSMVRDDDGAELGLRRAAARVVEALQHARDNHWPTVTLANDGGTADPERGPAKQLRNALAELETALDVETDTAEVLASRPTDASDDDDEPKGLFSARTTSDEQRLIYGIQGIADAMYNEDVENIEPGLPIALKKLVDDLAGKL